MLIALGMWGAARGLVPGLLWPVLSVLLGCSFAGLVFLGHETLHGGTLRGRRLRQLAGWYCFLPFCVSPRLWTAWHNVVHHGNANRPGRDPDAYPTLEEHRADRAVRIATDWFGVGRRKLRGLVSLSIGFSFQSLHVLVRAARKGHLTPRQHRLAILETLLGAGVWVALFALLGPTVFLFTCLVPLLVANAIVMAYIFTNHGLSPHTDVNDPLVNSLSVTVPAWVDFLTLRFGFHVEHHLFPWMSTRHAPLVRDLLRERYPDRYQSLPLFEALARIFRTPRVYADPTTLIDPDTGETYPTLGTDVPERSEVRASRKPITDRGRAA